MHTLESGNVVGRLAASTTSSLGAAAPLLAHGKASCTALRLVYDPAGTGSWVKLRGVGERLGADASSGLGAVVLKAATGIPYAHTSTSSASPNGSRFADAAGPPAVVKQWVRCLKCRSKISKACWSWSQGSPCTNRVCE